MATYTDYFSLKRPSGAENVLVSDLNQNTTKIDLVMHQNRQMSADAYDTTETYNTGDIVIYEDMLYKCNADNITGNWDSTKWENTTLAAEIVAGGGAAPDLTGVCGEAYDPTETYAVGDLVIYDNVLYKCNTAGTTGTWDSTKWDSTTLADEIINGGGGGGSSTLAGLNDVDITTPSDGQLLIYDDTNDEWVNGNIAGVNVQPVVYSLDEREIGVWTDGKPLYQKTIVVSSAKSISSGSWTTIFTDNFIGTIAQLVTVEFINPANSGAYNAYNYKIVNNNLQIIVNWSGGFTLGAGSTFALRYTKTTDTPGSGTWTPSGVKAIHYSTNEQVVGTWVDGSTLYETTVPISEFPPSTSEKKYAHNISNIDKIIYYEGVMRWTNGQVAEIPYAQIVNGSFSGGGSCDVNVDKTDIIIRVGVNRSSFDGHVTIRYTKTSS